MINKILDAISSIFNCDNIDIIITFIVPIVTSMFLNVKKIISLSKHIKINSSIHKEYIRLIKNKSSISAKSTKNKKSSKISKKQNNVMNYFYKEKKKQIRKSLTIIMVSIVFYFCIHTIFNIEMKIGIILFLYAYALMALIAQLLLNYRIENGYYGTNYEEAKELLYYIKNNKNNKRISGKKILNAEKECNRLKLGVKSPLTDKY